jgi:hypothetical protein
MEIRIKYSNSGLLLFIIVTVGLIVAGFLFSYICWIPVGVFAYCVVLSISDAVKNKADAIVINDEGVWVDGVFEVDWSQVDHCYVSIRTGGDASDDYYLVFVTKQKKRHEICLDRYIYKYVFPTKKLARDINHLMSREICYMTSDDKAYEKMFRLSVLKQLAPTLIVVALTILIALIISLFRTH